MMRRDKSLALAEGARLFVRKTRHDTKRIMERLVRAGAHDRAYRSHRHRAIREHTQSFLVKPLIR